MAKIISLLIQTDKQASDKAPYGCGPNEKGYTLSLFPNPWFYYRGRV